MLKVMASYALLAAPVKNYHLELLTLLSQEAAAARGGAHVGDGSMQLVVDVLQAIADDRMPTASAAKTENDLTKDEFTGLVTKLKGGLPHVRNLPPEGGLTHVRNLPPEGGLPRVRNLPPEGGLTHVRNLLPEGGLPRVRNLPPEGGLTHVRNLPPEGGLPRVRNLPPEGGLTHVRNLPPEGGLPRVRNLLPMGGLPRKGQSTGQSLGA
eukprot:gene16803-23083_t